jgi:hypothetical protein
VKRNRFELRMDEHRGRYITNRAAGIIDTFPLAVRMEIAACRRTAAPA